MIVTSIDMVPKGAAFVPCHNLETAFWYHKELEKGEHIPVEVKDEDSEHLWSKALWFVVLPASEVN